MNDITRKGLCLYVPTVIASITANHMFYKRTIDKSFKESKRNLTYKTDLCTSNRYAIKNLKWSINYEKFKGYIKSMVPIYNVIFTSEHLINEDFHKEDYEDMIKNIMAIIDLNEAVMREMILINMQMLPMLPEDIEDKIKSPEYKPSEKDFKKALKLNGINPKNGRV